MAKANGRPKAPKPANRNTKSRQAADSTLEYVDDGIFNHVDRVDSQGRRTIADGGLFDRDTKGDASLWLNRYLDFWRKRAAEIVRPHAIILSADLMAICPRVRELDLGEGRKNYAFPTDLTHEACTAIECLHCVDVLRQLIADGAPPSDLYTAFCVGQLTEMLYVMPGQPDAFLGKSQRKVAKVAGHIRRLRLEERKAWVRHEYAESLKDDPQDRKKARGKVRDAFRIKFPKKTIELDTIKKYVSQPRA
jgi:hypothetical protein